MIRLASFLYAMVATSLAGGLMIFALVSGYDSVKFILIAVGTGAVIALPVSIYIAKALGADE